MALSAYGQLLRLPGVPRMAASALVLGIAGTMAPVSFVLFAHRATGSFASASLVLAASTAGGLLAAPFRGRLIDRIGPSAAILRLALPSAATDVAFILAGHARAAAPILIAIAFVAGAIIAPSTAAVRSVWSELLARTELRQAGYALIGVLQEVAFVGGPLVAGGVIALWSTTAAVAVTAALSLVGRAGVRDRADHPPPRAPGPAAPRPARHHPGDADRADQRRRLRRDVRRARRCVPRLRARPRLGCRRGSAARRAGGRDRHRQLPDGPAPARALGGPPLRAAVRARGRRAAAAHHHARARRDDRARGPRRALLRAGDHDARSACSTRSPRPSAQAEAFAWLAILYGAGSAAGAALGGQLVEASGPRAAIVAACAATVVAWLVTTARAKTLSEPRVQP